MIASTVAVTAKLPPTIDIIRPSLVLGLAHWTTVGWRVLYQQEKFLPTYRIDNA